MTNPLSSDRPTNTNYLYLSKNHRQTFSWPRNIRHPISKLLKYLSESFFADFCCQEGISCSPYNTYSLNQHPNKHFLFSKTSWRRLEDVFSVTLFVFQDVFKTYLRYVFLKRLQDVFKTFSRRLQDVFARRLAIISSRRLQDVLEDKQMLHWRRLQDVFSTSSPRRMFAGISVRLVFGQFFDILGNPGKSRIFIFPPVYWLKKPDYSSLDKCWKSATSIWAVENNNKRIIATFTFSHKSMFKN